MIFNVIHELISDMTIHITTYDTCVYVDNSVDLCSTVFHGKLFFKDA